MISPEHGSDPKMEAQMRWGVNLDDVEAVLRKTQELLRHQSTRGDGAELSNLFRDYTEGQSEKGGEEAGEMAA